MLLCGNVSVAFSNRVPLEPFPASVPCCITKMHDLAWCLAFAGD